MDLNDDRIGLINYFLFFVIVWNLSIWRRSRVSAIGRLEIKLGYLNIYREEGTATIS